MKFLFIAAGVVLAADIYAGFVSAQQGGQMPDWFNKTLAPVEAKTPLLPLWAWLAAGGGVIWWMGKRG